MGKNNIIHRLRKAVQRECFFTIGHDAELHQWFAAHGFSILLPRIENDDNAAAWLRLCDLIIASEASIPADTTSAATIEAWLSAAPGRSAHIRLLDADVNAPPIPANDTTLAGALRGLVAAIPDHEARTEKRQRIAALEAELTQLRREVAE